VIVSAYLMDHWFNTLSKKRLPKRVQRPLLVPQTSGQVWSADFMSDALYEGKRIRTFNVIDDFNREILAIEIDTSPGRD